MAPEPAGLPPLPPVAPGLGGGGYISLATASGRLPAVPLEPSYSMRPQQESSSAMVVEAEGEAEGGDGPIPDPGQLRPQQHLNPLFEPVTLYLNPMLNNSMEGPPRSSRSSWARPSARRR